MNILGVPSNYHKHRWSHFTFKPNVKTDCTYLYKASSTSFDMLYSEGTMGETHETY